MSVKTASRGRSSASTDCTCTASAIASANRMRLIGLSEPSNRLTVVNVVRPTGFVMPNRSRGNAERVVNRRGHVLGRLWARCRIAADAIGRADDLSAAHTAAGEEYGLYRAPMVAARLAINIRELR